MMPSLTTARLLLRPWKESDRQPFRSLNADPQVMAFMPALLTRESSDLLMDRIKKHFQEHNVGLFAAEIRQSQTFIGFIGLSTPSFTAPFMPAYEIGWRLDSRYWGQGLATEGAREVLRFGTEDLGLGSVASFTVPANMRSRRVMERLGMTHDPRDDFDHPNLPEGHPLRRHVLYRFTVPKSSAQH